MSFATISEISIKNFSLENDFLVTSCFTILGQERQMFEGIQNMLGWSKTQPKTPKDVKLNAIPITYLGTLIYFYFDPQNSKYQFSKINNY